MELEEIPTDGVHPSKVASFQDLIYRYLVDNDKYNQKAVFGGIFPALQAIENGKSLVEVIRSIGRDISGFQLNWVMNTLGEYSLKSEEIRTTWEKYQKGLEPKKKSARRYKQTIPDPGE